MYKKLHQKHLDVITVLSKRNKIFGWARLLTIVAFIISMYQFLNQQYNYNFLFLSLGLLVLFFMLLTLHQKNSWARKLRKALLTIVENEQKHLKGQTNIFDNGSEFVDETHFYTHDLDVFGKNSLFEYLNRTATFVGKKRLAARLSSMLKPEEILENQDAIQDIKNSVEWRHELLALAQFADDSEKNYQELITWATDQKSKIPKIIVVLSYILPSILLVVLGMLLFTGNALYLNLAIYLFIGNLLVLSTQRKRILKETFESDKIIQTFKHYGLLLQNIEKETFQSQKMQRLQQQLSADNERASQQFAELSKLFSGLHSIGNLIGALLFNGTFLYHIHILKRITAWKIKNGHQVKNWLSVIGEVEFLNSLANLAYNHPDFVFPEINSEQEIAMEEMGHPLIRKEKRVCNSIQFKPNDFVILTGSNMSGKSTFLRTIGVNMILTGMGSVICATKANVHPLPLLVSMRQKDSLTDSESYFFAEVKRLKQIIEYLQQEPSFVLLDEILRGTNSDDKHKGTIEIIKKMMNFDVSGVIATHDLEVCNLSELYDNRIENQCFEVDFVSDNLYFDYKLRPGVCKNKSATFLMEKMGII